MDIVRRLLPNIVTFTRIPLTIILYVYITRELGNVVFPLIIFIIILLTDYYDGKIARYLKTESKIGAVLDVCADLFFVLVTYINVSIHGILPLWFVYIIAFKFLEFIVTSFIYKKLTPVISTKGVFDSRDSRCDNGMFLFDTLGKFAVTMFYIIPMYAYITSILVESFYFATIGYLICVASFCAIISSVYRVRRCLVQWYEMGRGIFDAKL